MEYTVTVQIEAPLGEVIGLFDAPENWPQWREGYVSAEPIHGELGEAGSRVRLVTRVGGRETVMTETVELKNLPDEMVCIYEAPGVFMGAWNRVVHRFRAKDPSTTEWEMYCEFKCRGLLNILSKLMPNMFRNATLKEMKSFTHFVETQRCDPPPSPAADT